VISAPCPKDGRLQENADGELALWPAQIAEDLETGPIAAFSLVATGFSVIDLSTFDDVEATKRRSRLDYAKRIAAKYDQSKSNDLLIFAR
jgi:hypothetical protein